MLLSARIFSVFCLGQAHPVDHGKDRLAADLNSGGERDKLSHMPPPFTLPWEALASHANFASCTPAGSPL